MKTTEAIARADGLRTNTATDEQKAAWLNDLDGSLAEMMGIPPPENKWPEDAELLMPRPHEEIYVLYLVARIDYDNQELALYANDMELFNQAMRDARSWWRRHHLPPDAGNWRL